MPVIAPAMAFPTDSYQRFQRVVPSGSRKPVISAVGPKADPGGEVGRGALPVIVGVDIRMDGSHATRGRLGEHC